MSKIGLIITAGGKGSRFGSATPKQLLEINQKPIFLYSLEKFLSIDEIVSIVITYPSGFESTFKMFVSRYTTNKDIYLVEGGIERMWSVWNGLKHPSIQACDFVLVHDSVRPFVSKELTLRIIYEVQHYLAVVPGLPTYDTMKIGAIDGFVENTIDRSKIVCVQTPQAFQTKLLTEAFNSVLQQQNFFTDESGIIEKYGHKVKIIRGEEINFKITTLLDFEIAKLLVESNILQLKSPTSS